MPRKKKKPAITWAKRIADTMRRTPPLPDRVHVVWRLGDLGLWEAIRTDSFSPLMVVSKKGRPVIGVWYDLGRK